MREILFRGKDVDTKEWIYGGYCQHDTVKVCFTTDDPKTKHMIIKDGFCDWGLEPPLQGYEVDPETVGQYTGVKDKNGVRIFEGDIVVCDRHINDEFDKKTFFVREIYPISGLIGESLSGNEICGDDWEFAEVIGNIHDNPELLKEGGLE